MKAKDLMQKEVFTVQSDDALEKVVDIMVQEHVHGAPVLNGTGALVGVVTQHDVFFSTVTLGKPDSPPGDPQKLLVKDVMTSPAVSATEDTDVRQLCRMMHRLRIHRVPIARDGRLLGIVSSLDVCAAVSRGDIPG